MRGRRGQGSDRTGRAHSLTTLLHIKVPTKIEVNLVRVSLWGPRLHPLFLQILAKILEHGLEIEHMNQMIPTMMMLSLTCTNG